MLPPTLDGSVGGEPAGCSCALLATRRDRLLEHGAHILGHTLGVEIARDRLAAGLAHAPRLVGVLVQPAELIGKQAKIAGHRKLAGVVHVGGKFAPEAVDALYIGCRGTIDQLVSDLPHVEAGDGMATAGGERVAVGDVPPRKPASQRSGNGFWRRA